jgi:ABC-type branched-subunit amino acid transport system ATPase component
MDQVPANRLHSPAAVKRVQTDRQRVELPTIRREAGRVIPLLPESKSGGSNISSAQMRRHAGRTAGAFSELLRVPMATSSAFAHWRRSLTVEENLKTTASKSSANPRWTLDRVYALFPRLAERRRNMGDQLSGGEQQMLAIGRALMTNPRLLVLDEATEGLAPVVRNGIWRALEALERERLSILLVDKDIEALSHFANRHYILEKGRIVWHGTSAELASAPELRRYLTV